MFAQVESRRDRAKRLLKHVIYIIKSYLKLEDCVYCGSGITLIKDEGDICYKCWPKS